MGLLPLLLIALLVIAAAATGVGVLATSGGSKSFACMDVGQNGSNVQVTTSGLIHFLKGQYYVTCTEGSSLPTSPLTTSCLTISPQLVTAQIGAGASTYYYNLNAPGHQVALQGAPNPTNGTEIVTPAGVSIVVSC
jgi:hypothetical protein